MNDGASIRPSWWYLSVGVALAAVGCGLFVYFVWNGLSHMTDPVTQIVVPGEADLKLTRPGRYTVFFGRAICGEWPDFFKRETDRGAEVFGEAKQCRRWRYFDEEGELFN